MSMRSFYLAILNLGVLLSTSNAQTAKLALSSNLALKLGGVKAGSSFFTVANTTFTVDKTNSSLGQQAKEIFDLSFDDVYVLVKSAQNDGIVCNVDNQCVDQSTDICAYQGQSVSCSKATTLMRFEPVEVKQQGVPQLTFKLLTPDDKWLANYGSNGVWGLSPKSPFWDFLQKTYQQSDYIDLSYKIALKSEDNMYSMDSIALDDKSQVTVNGRSESTDLAFADFDSKYGAWVWPNAKLSLTSGKPNNSVEVCIDNSVNAYFLVSDDDYDNLRDHVNGQLCEIEDGEEFCYKNSSKFENVDDMEITFNGNSKKSVSVNLGAFDFIHYDDEERGLFGVEPMNKSSVCSKAGAKFAVGRLFFTKAELTIRSQGSGKFQLGIAKVKRETSIILPILLLVVGIILIVAIGTIAYTQLPRDEKKADGEYEEAKESPAKATEDQ